MKFSIITPVGPGEEVSPQCALSTVWQLFTDFEWITEEDPLGEGPGVARNRALARAKGEWIIFLDSDDELAHRALLELDKATADNDIVLYGWTDSASNDHTPPSGDNEELIRKYLRLQLDGSVIFTAVRRDLLSKHGIRFAAGLHEDVDFMYGVYLSAKKIGRVQAPLYQKSVGRITQSISVAHLQGFLRAWNDIGLFAGLPNHPLHRDYQIGTMAVVATRVREILLHTRPDIWVQWHLFEALYAELISSTYVPTISRDDPLDTQYARVAKLFVDTMEDSSLNKLQRALRIEGTAKKLFKQTWSCRDLQESLYLGPDEVRACCKRFFVNGERRGDVVLLKEERPTLEKVVTAKQALKTAINKGDETPCSGCPFLEFKEWGPIEPKVNYLSLEHHSVCNLKCSYCSPTYYGGKMPTYDVSGLLLGLLDGGAMDGCHTVIWGGGEPTLGPRFEELLGVLATRLTHVKQRVLTNTVRFSGVLAEWLRRDRVTVTTSVDAGTDDTFALVRGRDRLRNVMMNLERYAKDRPEGVTVKYIFTEQNSTQEEVSCFVQLAKDYGLKDCNFQLSADFREEGLTVEQAVAVVALHAGLRELGVKVLFLDDLMHQRLLGLQDRPGLWARLSEDDLCEAVLDDAHVALWGCGQLGNLLMEHTRLQFDLLVDDRTGPFLFPPSALLEHPELPIVLAASQSYPELYRRACEMGLEDRIVKEIVL